MCWRCLCAPLCRLRPDCFSWGRQSRCWCCRYVWRWQYLWDYTAGRTVGMLALELLLLCFGVSVLVQLYLQANFGNFAAVSTATALVVLSLDWLFFYYMPGYADAALRYIAFVLPSAVLTIPAALLAFWLVQRIHDGFEIDNGVV